jgi:hypothetical protein
MIIYRFKPPLRGASVMILLAIALSGCVADPAESLNCELSKSSSGKIVVTAEDITDGSNVVAKRARELREQLSKSPSMAGFTGSIFKTFAGTKTYSFATELNDLRGNVAWQVAMQQAYFNEGKTLVPTTKRWSCEVLADSVSSLNLGQSSDQLIDNLLEVEQHSLEMSEIFSSIKVGDQK